MQNSVRWLMKNFVDSGMGSVLCLLVWIPGFIMLRLIGLIAVVYTLLPLTKPVAVNTVQSLPRSL